MAEGMLRVAQLNAGSLLEPGWDERREVVVSWLDHLAPDVVCLQEVWRDGSGTDTAAWIVDRLGGDDWYWRFGGHPFAESFWPDPSLAFGSAILSRWPIDEHAHHRLPVIEGQDAVVDGVPWELLHVRTAGLDVFSTHLAPAPTHGLHRHRQVVAIDDHVRRVRGSLDDLRFGAEREAMPAILCGDFNAEPDSDEIRFLCGLTPLGGRTTYWVDAWREAGAGPGQHVRPAGQPAGGGDERDHQAHRLRVRGRPVPARRGRRPRPVGLARLRRVAHRPRRQRPLGPGGRPRLAHPPRPPDPTPSAISTQVLVAPTTRTVGKRQVRPRSQAPAARLRTAPTTSSGPVPDLFVGHLDDLEPRRRAASAIRVRRRAPCRRAPSGSASLCTSTTSGTPLVAEVDPTDPPVAPGVDLAAASRARPPAQDRREPPLEVAGRRDVVVAALVEQLAHHGHAVAARAGELVERSAQRWARHRRRRHRFSSTLGRAGDGRSRTTGAPTTSGRTTGIAVERRHVAGRQPGDARAGPASCGPSPPSADRPRPRAPG